jgi:uncharacterized repeat protein (TIGR03803 family)
MRSAFNALGGSTGACSSAGCGVVFRIAPDGTEAVLYAFTCGTDGTHPLAGVIDDPNGNLYGTTYSGGTDDDGVVFKLTPKRTFVVLNSSNGNGNASVANLTARTKGVLYGTTEFGPNDTVFEVKK